MTLRCQFIARRVCGFRSWKQRIAKVAKSWRSRTSYSAWSVFRTSLFPFREAHLELLDHLLVRLAEDGGLGRGRLGLALDVSHQVEQDLDRAPIRCSRAVDELSDDRLALADLPTPAVLGHDNRLVQRVTQQRADGLLRIELNSFRGPSRRSRQRTSPPMYSQLACVHHCVGLFGASSSRARGASGNPAAGPGLQPFVSSAALT